MPLALWCPRLGRTLDRDSRSTGLKGKGREGQGAITDSAAAAGKPTAASARKPTFLQRERWQVIQKARRKGMSLPAIERELRINRATVRKYRSAEGPPTRKPQVGPATPTSNTMAA